MSTTSLNLPLTLPAAPASDGAVAGLLEALADGEWHTATEICVMLGLPPTEAMRRRIRGAADASGGRIAGGQCGYKLVTRMTRAEYDHARNFLLSQAREMQRRVLEMDRVFYHRQPAPHPA